MMEGMREIGVEMQDSSYKQWVMKPKRDTVGRAQDLIMSGSKGLEVWSKNIDLWSWTLEGVICKDSKGDT